MGASGAKQQPLWVDPPGPNAPMRAVPYVEPDVVFTKGGKPAYPEARGPGYTPYRDPLPEMPVIYNKAGKPIKPSSVPPSYVPPGANHPPVPKGAQMVNGPKGPTLLCKSKSVAYKCDMADGFADGLWFGIPIAVGVMLDAPVLDYGYEVPVEVPSQPLPPVVPLHAVAPPATVLLPPPAPMAQYPYVY